MCRLLRRKPDIWARLNAPSLSVVTVGMVLLATISPRNCCPQAASFAPSQAAMYSASVTDRETMSWRRLYHPIGWSPRVVNTPVCDLACSPPYLASAYTLRSRFVGFCKIIPSFFVEYKYYNTWWDAFRLIVLGFCKEVTYRVYSFVTTSQGYPEMLSCDLNKHVSCLSDHVIIESYGIH